MPDIVVIGGGIIGLLTARQLRLAGAEVSVIERGQLGGESSWAGGGIISPLYPWRYDASVNVLAQRSKQIYPELVPALLEDSGIDAELLTSGLLIVDDDEAQSASDWAQTYKERLERIEDSDRLHRISPVTAAHQRSALWMPDVMQVRNPLLVKAMRGSCEKLGIEAVENAEVSELVIEADRVRAVIANGQRMDAERIVVASGAWSGKLLSGRVDVDVHPVKGQMVMMKTEPGTVEQIIMDRGHYVIPRQDGHVLAGSTLEHAGFDKSITDEAETDLYRQACELVPVLSDYPVIRHWAGLRPGTQQGIPYICEHDQTEGLYIHAGHYRNGIVLGAASAELLSQMITGEETFCDPSPYNLDSSH